jgi:hypothetical protein
MSHETLLGAGVEPDSEANNLLNGIAANAPAHVTNLAITKPGTMLRNGLESSNAQPAYFSIHNRIQLNAGRLAFILGRKPTPRLGLLRMTGFVLL